jgi:hypothetical protein
MERILWEACRTHNLLHPNDPADAATLSWPRLYPLVLSFIRHELSGYEIALQTGGADRDQLQAEISTAARKFYPWLRKDKDPRTVAAQPQERPPGDLKIFTELSRYGSELRHLQDRLLTARRKAISAIERREIDAELAEIRYRIAAIDDKLRPNPDELPPDMRDFRLLIMEQVEPGYYFAGRELPPNRIEPMPFSCDVCGQRVWKTKVPLDLGSGVKLVVMACHCGSVSITGGYANQTTAKAWHLLMTDEKPTEE